MSKELGQDEIHIWYVDPAQIQDKAQLEHYKTLLSTDESAKLTQFRFVKHQHQYLITRALVRCVLSLYHPQIHPNGWIFKSNSFGKPFIENDCPLFFNVSHTDDYIVLALSYEKNIGIDIEKISAKINFIEIAEKNFSEREVELLKKSTEDLQPQVFFSLWTLKEAYCKALGEGLSIPLHTICFAENNFPKNWQFWQTNLDQTHILSMGINTFKMVKINHIFPFNPKDKLCDL